MKPIQPILLVLFFLYHMTLAAYTSNTLYLGENKLNYFLTSNQLSQWEDSLSYYRSPLEIIDKPFGPLENQFFTNKNHKSSYWIKINILDTASVMNQWYFISYNQAVDSLAFFMVVDGKMVVNKTFNYRHTKLFERDVAHKNLLLDLPLPKNREAQVYIRIKNAKSFQYGFAIREHKEYFSSSIREYFFFGIFYGAIIILAIYQLFFFFSLKDYAYVFYVVYIVIQGVYLCLRDATGMVFLFGNFPHLMQDSYKWIMLMLSFSVLFYLRFFISLRYFKWLDITMFCFVLVRSIVAFAVEEYSIGVMIFDFSALGIAFFFSILSWIQGFKTAPLFVLSFFVITLGHGINVLWHANIIPCTDNIFYSLYYAVVVESLVLALANAYRLSSLRENALLKSVLERKVKENSSRIQLQEKIIQQKADELDVFLYRASHDIKGPLKSIEGLSRVGLLDEKNKDEYFKKIISSTENLQKILNALLNLAKQNQSSIQWENIKVLDIIQECLQNQLQEYPGFHEMEITVQVPSYAEVNGDKYLFLSIIQNLVENAIKYRDQNKKENTLTILWSEKNAVRYLEFIDNGIGVNESVLTKLFQMFYRANKIGVEGAGLGLYIVKSNVERLGGKIFIDSKEFEFTKIWLEFPANTTNN